MQSTRLRSFIWVSIELKGLVVANVSSEEPFRLYQAY